MMGNEKSEKETVPPHTGVAAAGISGQLPALLCPGCSCAGALARAHVLLTLFCVCLRSYLAVLTKDFPGCVIRGHSWAQPPLA